jgi:putative membrane protein
MVLEHRIRWTRIFAQIARPLLGAFGLAIVLALLDRGEHRFRPVGVPELPLVVIGAALSILLGFRTSSAYARWWEARTLWGGLVNASRTLARQAVAYALSADEDERAPALLFARALVYEQMAYIHALRCHLRSQDPLSELHAFLDEETIEGLRGEKNVPVALLQRMEVRAAMAAERGLLNELRLQRLDVTLADLCNLQGGCERIKNTPLPRQYDYYPELFVKIYCLFLPFTLVERLGMATPWVVLLVGFVLLVLNRIGKNLEDPFEDSAYDIPMSSLSRTIEINLRQQLGEVQLPPSIPVVDDVLR